MVEAVGEDSLKRQLDWLMAGFVAEVPGVSHGVLVSADGLLMALSPGLPEERADQLAAVAAGLASLSVGVAGLFEGGDVSQSLVEMERGYLLLMAVGEGSYLAVLTNRSGDIGQVGYEMSLLVERAGEALQAHSRVSSN